MFRSFCSLVLMFLVLVLAATSFINRHLTEMCFTHLSYYIISLLFGTWLFSFYKFICFHKREVDMFVGQSRLGMIVALVLTILIFIAITPSMRVFYDEVNLCSVSQSMTFSRVPTVLNECEIHYGVRHPLFSYIDKRPLFFPYAVSVLHTFTGYRTENVFVLNFMVLTSFLFLIYCCIRKIQGEVVAISTVFLVISHPVIPLCATSGGFDLMSTLFMFLCLLMVVFYVRYPSNITFHFLWMTFLVFSNIRYESILYFALAICILSIFRFIKREHWRSLWFYIWSIILLLPLLWQRALKTTDPQLDVGEKMFSVKHFIENNEVFLKSFLRFDFYLPYATIILWFGGIAVICLFIKVLISMFRDRDNGRIVWLTIILATISSAWIVITSYFGARCDDIVSARFYLPFCIVFSISLSLGLCSLRWVRKNTIIMLLFSIVLFLIYFPIAIEKRIFAARRGFSRNYHLAMNYMESVKDEGDDVLVVAFCPKQMTIHGFGAIRFSRANIESDTYLYRLANKLYKDIYVIQEIDNNTGAPLREYRLSPAYKLLPVYEAQNRGGRFLRISKVLTGSS